MLTWELCEIPPRWAACTPGLRPSQAPPSNVWPVAPPRSEPQHLPRQAGVLEVIIAGRVLVSLRSGFVAGRHECRPHACPDSAEGLGPAAASFRRLAREGP